MAKLNADQQAVLDWMKRDLPNLGVERLLCELSSLTCTSGWLKNELIALAYYNLEGIEILQVLQAFAEGGLSNESA